MGTIILSRNSLTASGMLVAKEVLIPPTSQVVSGDSSSRTSTLWTYLYLSQLFHMKHMVHGFSMQQDGSFVRRLEE
jgi:hypothetical protein